MKRRPHSYYVALLMAMFYASSSSTTSAFLISSNIRRCITCPTCSPSPYRPSLFNHNDENEFFIEKASTKARALDVKVFRGYTVSAKEEHVLEQHQKGNEMTENEAIDALMKNYNEYGEYIFNPPHCEAEVYFVAVYNGATNNPIEENAFDRTNGVVGVVSAQLRRRSPLIAGPSSNDENENGSLDSTALPSVPIPSPHIYVANMRVDDKMRRRGVGIALLLAVKEYAETWEEEEMDESIPMALSVDNDNVGAIRLYERFGFEYLEKNDVFRVMIMWP